MSEAAQTPPAYYVGVALNQTQYRSAAVVVERVVVEEKPHYRIPAIRHWPTRTSYTTVAADLKVMLAKPTLSGATVMADFTTSGAPVFEMLRKSGLEANPRGVIVTGGAVELLKPDGIYNVSKQILISTLEIVIGQRRIEFAETLPETATILKEMANYSMRVAPSASEVYAARDSEFDELIVSLALGLWAGERHDRWSPKMEIFNFNGLAPVEADEDAIGVDGLTQYQRERLPGYRPPEQIAEGKEFDRLIRMSEAERKAEEDKRLWEYLTGPAAFVGGEEVEDGWQ